MWYTLGHANTFICTPAHGGRAGNPGDRAPVPVRLYRTTLPNPPRQCRGSIDHHDCARPALHRSDRPQRAACLPPARPRGVAAPLVPTALHLDHLRCWGLRIPPGAVAPESTDVRPAHEPVDARVGRRGQFRPGPHTAPGQRRSHSCGPPPVGRVMETRQTLDHQPRSGLCPKKKRRDRLIQRARTQPTWALGFGDEVWWSRLAQPDQHCWTDADTMDKLQELTPPTDAPDAKALACYGLLVRPGPHQLDPRWLRFVSGRPVSAVTLACLAWCSAR